MARNNRSRKRDGEYEPLDVDRLRTGWRRTETRGGSSWVVQPISTSAALKSYTCPGCSQNIAPGIAHLVTWRADGILGDDADLADRRHWHEHCWKLS